MVLLLILKLVLCCWFLLLLAQSITNDFISLALISGTIITSMPFILIIALTAGTTIFRSVFLFSIFTLVVIALHLTQLVMG